MLEQTYRPNKLKFQRVVVIDLETRDYLRALDLQRKLQHFRIVGDIPDCLVLLEHPPTLTLGRAGGENDILVSRDWLDGAGFKIYQVERGGGVTYHGPGQLVGYPIIDLNNYRRDVHQLVYNLEEVIVRVLNLFGIKGRRREGFPGVWVDNAKIASIGIEVTRWVSMHGFSLNVNTMPEHFKTINPCGLQGVLMTSMCELLARPVAMREVRNRVVEEMARVFHWEQVLPGDSVQRLLEGLDMGFPDFTPGWLAVSPPAPGVLERMTRLIGEEKLNTVCREACCPNAAECFGLGTATFMILGEVCTRNCRFCSVQKGIPRAPDPAEPQSLAETVKVLGLKHVVVTSVTRDDLPDGGAGHFAGVINAVRGLNPPATVEVLVSDFQGEASALEVVIAAYPEVLGHNLETVPRLYGRVRPRTDYLRSLRLLETVKKTAPQIITKSGIMVGLGEEPVEVLALLDDLRAAGCDYITIGQYLRPSPAQLPVYGFVTPSMFAWYRDQCLRKGFKKADCAPLVRSSYHAGPL